MCAMSRLSGVRTGLVIRRSEVDMKSSFNATAKLERAKPMRSDRQVQRKADAGTRKPGYATRTYETSLRLDACGRFFITLPHLVFGISFLKIGQRVWFTCIPPGLHITKRPWGPRPTERRLSSRIRHIRARSTPRRELLSWCGRGHTNEAGERGTKLRN
jgi:hypothetical protein